MWMYASTSSICYIISTPSGLILTGHVTASAGKPQKAWGCFWFVDIIMTIPSSSNFDLENPCKVQANAHPPNCCTVVPQADERNPATMAMQNPFEGNALPPYLWAYGALEAFFTFVATQNIISISFYMIYDSINKRSSDLNGHLHSSKARGSTFPPGKLGFHPSPPIPLPDLPGFRPFAERRVKPQPVTCLSWLFSGGKGGYVTVVTRRDIIHIYILFTKHVLLK